MAEPGRRKGMPAGRCTFGIRQRQAAYPLALVIGSICLLGGARAQDGGARSQSLSSSVDTALTYTDLLRYGGGPNDGSDVALSVRPGVQFASRAGRVRGSLSYSLDLIQHTRKSDPSEARNSLNAAFVAELVEGRLFVDTQATISQGSISAFGAQASPSSVTENANRTEVGTLSIAPNLKGPIGSLATYEIRLNAAGTNTRRSLAGDSVTTGGSVSVNSASSSSLVGWGLQASQQKVDYRVSETTATDLVQASVSLRPDPEISLALRLGREGSDVTTTERTVSTTSGGTLRWTPTERTIGEISADERYFGRSHRLTLSHRLARSSFSLTSTRDTTNSAALNGVGQPVTLYQAFYAQLASQIPDPVQREQAVLDLIRGLGQDPDAIVGGGFVNTGVSLQQRQDLTWTYTGLRTTMSLQGFSSRSTVLGNSAQQPAPEPVRQAGYTALMAYRLTPTASVSLTGSRLVTYGTLTQPGTDLKSLSLSWNDQLGRRTSANAALRYSTFISANDPYRELAATVSFSLRF